MMTLRQIRHFIAVAETGSISAAAQAVFISQSTLTLAIQQLEEEIGVSLFNRHAKGMSLTHQGHQFLRQAHLACGAMEQAQAQLLLQARHVLAHGRGRDAKRAACLGKAQKIGGTYKGLKSAEAVHGDWQPWVGIVGSFTAIFV